MTIAAINAVVARMVFMAELDGLLPFRVTSGQIRRTCNLRINKKRYASEKYCNDYTYFRNIVCCAMKYLCHFLSLAHNL